MKFYQSNVYNCCTYVYSVKWLPKSVTVALKLIYKHIENYIFKTQYDPGVKT